MKKIAVLCSGGDSPGMNACIRAVVQAGHYHGIEIWGVKRGYNGLMDDDFLPLHTETLGNIIHLGGTILKSARAPRFMTYEGRAQAFQNLQKRGMDGLVVIGGDGSYTGAKIFLQEFPEMKIIGTPGTIDNDLYGTDFTIGYDTAINTAMQAIDRLRDTADSHDRLFFVEVMGRDAGFIALRSGIGSGADAVLVPETKTDVDALIAHLESGWNRRKSSMIVIVAEGDDAGGAFEVARKVGERFKQYDTKVSILGHIQRGGSPTCMDRVLAGRLGVAAVEALKEGKSGFAAGVLHRETVLIPFEQAIKHNTELNANLLRLAEILGY